MISEQIDVVIFILSALYIFMRSLLVGIKLCSQLYYWTSGKKERFRTKSRQKNVAS